MSTVTYLIDGRRYSAAETKNMFSDVSLGKREQVVLSMIENSSDNKTILDLGCLYGVFCKTLKQNYPHSIIIGGDYTEENLKISRLLCPEYSDIFRPLDAYNLDLRSSSVDILTFQEVIEHLEGAAQAIKEINRVLKIDGELILSTPMPYYWRDMIQFIKFEMLRKCFKKNLPISDSIYFKEHEWNRHIYSWTPSTLYTLLKVNGFEYITHAYCQEGKGNMERMFLKLFPFFSPTIILKVKKVFEASNKLV